MQSDIASKTRFIHSEKKQKILPASEPTNYEVPLLHFTSLPWTIAVSHTLAMVKSTLPFRCQTHVPKTHLNLCHFISVFVLL